MLETYPNWHWVFFKEKTNQFIILKDDQVTGEIRYTLYRDGYEVLFDSLRTWKEAEQYPREEYGLTKLKYQVMPITLKEACAFVNQYHRHHPAPHAHKLSISITDGDIVVGVIIAGRPVSRHQDDGLTLEITRCCVKEGYKNGVSKLYSAACNAAKALGYKKVITYTLSEENGASMRASNFDFIRISKGGSWNSSNRKRIDKHPTGPKYLWVRNIS